MASQAAYKVEQLVGHDGSSMTQQDVTNYETTGDNTHTMKALVWQGKNKVKVVETARPKLIEPKDVILKVTGSTLCGSDLHLLHGELSSTIHTRPGASTFKHADPKTRFHHPVEQW